jgi:hypothetical protein
MHLSAQSPARDGVIHAFNEGRRLLKLASGPLCDNLGSLGDRSSFCSYLLPESFSLGLDFSDNRIATYPSLGGAEGVKRVMHLQLGDGRALVRSSRLVS